MLNLKSIKIFACLLLSLFFHTVSGQAGTTNIGIAFAKGSVHLSELNRLVLDSFALQLLSVNKMDSFFMFKEFHVILFSNVSVSESKRRSKLGVLRCKAIIDYLESRYKIPRSYILICDGNIPNFYPIIEIGFYRRVP